MRLIPIENRFLRLKNKTTKYKKTTIYKHTILLPRILTHTHILNYIPSQNKNPQNIK